MDTQIEIEDRDGSIKNLILPKEMSLNLMEFLKANDYEIEATCGGMALCATCHIRVIKGLNLLDEPSNEEYAMLDTLPKIFVESRLSCQIPIDKIEGEIKIKIV